MVSETEMVMVVVAVVMLMVMVMVMVMMGCTVVLQVCGAYRRALGER